MQAAAEKGLAAVNQQGEHGICIHDRAAFLPGCPVGPFVRLPDGSILAIAGASIQTWAGGRLHRSTDEGATWEAWDLGVEGVEPADTGAFFCTREGTVILAAANFAARRWTWDSATHDMPGARLPTVVLRSRDGGRTWTDVQTLHPEWTGATRDILQTRTGRIVFTTMKAISGPGRHGVMTYASDDDGRTWTPSNLIDLGGNGHHGGMTEATLTELGDGRLLKYIRTNWGCFWRAESTDEGDHWHPYGPTPVPAATTPGMFHRLESGALALAYNQPDPVGGEAPLKGGDNIWSATPAKNSRGELSLRFSEDDGKSWTDPVVVARRDEGELCYPYLFEVEPGVLWITTHRFDLAMRLRVADVYPNG
ncbi:MAG: sialidase family protein [Planctomycetota bacterium]